MENNPLVSIITVSFNARKTIEQTIQSVLYQNYPYIEYIIIDGNSTDGTVDIIKKYSNALSYWISEPDKGIYDAMNKGIKRAKGDLIGILNSDDWYENDIINKVVENYSHNNPEIIYGDLMKHHKFNQFVCKPHRPLKQFWMGNVISHPTVFVPSVYYQKYGLFNTEYKIAADYDILVRFYKKGCHFKYLSYIITHMRTGGESDRNVILGYKEALKIAYRADFPICKILYAYLRKTFAVYLKNNIFLK